MFREYVLTENINYCPTCDMDCPYWQYNDVCTLTNPMEKCDDYYAITMIEENF